MRNPGLEPGCPLNQTLEPESSASTNSASSAYDALWTIYSWTTYIVALRAIRQAIFRRSQNSIRPDDRDFASPAYLAHCWASKRVTSLI